MSDFAYYPGCSLHATAREFDESLRAVAARLGLGLREVEDWVCCGATPAHAVDPESAEILGLWNLAHAAKGGTDPLLTGCASCFSRLRAARAEVRDRPERLAHVTSGLARAGLVVDPNLEVLHVAQVLMSPAVQQKIKAEVKRPLAGLKIACYYGCLLTRPRGEGIDDPEEPRLLEDLVQLLGAEPVDWPLRLDCCGASLALPRVDLVHELSGKILTMAHQRGAQVLMVACPLCHSNLDFQQDAALRALGADFRLPVLYLTQVVGLALGVPAHDLGLSRHFVPVPVERLIPAEGVGRV
jgi:heterodisulfide reductase subunit B